MYVSVCLDGSRGKKFPGCHTFSIISSLAEKGNSFAGKGQGDFPCGKPPWTPQDTRGDTPLDPSMGGPGVGSWGFRTDLTSCAAAAHGVERYALSRWYRHPPRPTEGGGGTSNGKGKVKGRADEDIRPYAIYERYVRTVGADVLIGPVAPRSLGPWVRVSSSARALDPHFGRPPARPFGRDGGTLAPQAKRKPRRRLGRRRGSFPFLDLTSSG